LVSLVVQVNDLYSKKRKFNQRLFLFFTGNPGSLGARGSVGDVGFPGS
jgi:hypothetical protein